MARRTIGFRFSEAVDEVDDQSVEVVEESHLDLHDELVKAINTLIQITQHFQGNIKGITINIDSKGNYSSKIKY